MFDNVNELIDYIYSYKTIKEKKNLNNMKKALELFGNPHSKFKSIHITGTNGKGSVVDMLSSIMIASGLNVATFTSPFIEVFNDRIKINNHNISDEDLLKYGTKVINTINNLDYKYSFFDVITLISILYFSNQRLDYVIYEVGIGGLLDSTNVIDSSICAITSVSLDHTSLLGDTEEEILFQKLGILKSNSKCFTVLGEKLYQIAKNKYINNDIINYSSTYQCKFELPLVGEHQIKNFFIVESILNELGIKLNANIIDKAFNNFNVKGRIEELKYNNKKVIIDGSHNIGGVLALLDYIDINKINHITVFFTVNKNKDYLKIYELLNKYKNIKLYLISLENQNDFNIYNGNLIKLEDSKDIIDNNCDKDNLFVYLGSIYQIQNIKKLLNFN